MSCSLAPRSVRPSSSAQSISPTGELWLGRSAELALACVHKEYPNKIAHVLNDGAGRQGAARADAAFFGCYDWHSSVHGHWLLARVAPRSRGRAVRRPRARRRSTRASPPENIAGEVRYLKGAGRVSFERPYGLAWLLQLHAELRRVGRGTASRPGRPEVGRAASTPLTRGRGRAHRRLAAEADRRPIRIGEHSQTAFSFGLMLDWARATGEKKLEPLLVSRVRDFHAGDRACPMNYEPSGEDFLSPCLAEADLVPARPAARRNSRAG